MAASLALYRQLWRIQRRWPVEQDRAGRNFKEALAVQLRTGFRQNKFLTDADEIALAIKTAQQDIEALQLVLNNNARLKFPRLPENELLSKSHYDKRQLLSTESQNTLKKGLPFLTNVMAFFSGLAMMARRPK